MYTNNQGNSTHTIIENIVHYNLLEWANYFYQSKKIEGVSGFTLTFYKRQLGHFMRYCESQLITSLEEITPNVLRQFLLWHQETGHNPGGLHAAYRTLRVFLLWYESEAEPEGWKNPIRKVKAPIVSNEPLSHVDPEDVMALLKTCKSTEILTIVMLLTVSGIAGRMTYERFSYFLYCFVVWDIFYYVGLKALLDWPSSLFTWDVLFLIPVVWIAPVLAPIVCATTIIIFSGFILYYHNKGYTVRITFGGWSLISLGALFILITFI